MGQLRTANKRRDRTLAKAVAAEKLANAATVSTPVTKAAA